MRGVVRRLGVLFAASAVMVVMGAAPAWAAPTIVATPSTDLIDGQVVDVTGSGLAPDRQVAVLQCVSGGTDVFAFCQIGGFVSTTTDSTGAFSTSFTVRRVISPTGEDVDCAASAGRCVLAVDDFSTDYDASTPLHFDPEGPLPPQLEITATPVSAAVRDNQVLLQGTVTCTVPTTVFIDGRLRQVVRRFFIDGFFETAVECDGETPFSVVFEGSNGVIRRGPAEVTLDATASTPDDFDEFSSTTELRVRRK